MNVVYIRQEGDEWIMSDKDGNVIGRFIGRAQCYYHAHDRDLTIAARH